MGFSTISKTKFGNCANPECNATNTEVVKVGKETFCLNCRTNQKNKVQIRKANEKSQVRGLMGKQKQEGNEPLAERQNLVQDIDWFFSRYLRIRESNQYGIINCYICGMPKQWSLSQAMHYISRSCILLRWDARNVKCGCNHCNVGLSGNLIEYAKKLNEEEAGLPEFLQDQSRQIYKPSLDELRQLLAEMKQKVKIVEVKLKKK